MHEGQFRFGSCGIGREACGELHALHEMHGLGHAEPWGLVLQMARFLPNPEANWGPKKKAGRYDKHERVSTELKCLEGQTQQIPDDL